MYKFAMLLAVSFLLTPAWADDAAKAPQKRETKKYSVGAGYAGSTVGADIPRDGDDSITLRGWGVRGRTELKKHWGLQLRYLSGDDSFSSGGELSLDQLGVQAYYKWFESEQKYFHAYAKFGLAWMDFEERVPPASTFSDQALGPVIGVGLEWGPPRWAFFVDFGFTFVDIELIPGNKESLTVGSTITGLAYRF